MNMVQVLAVLGLLLLFAGASWFMRRTRAEAFAIDPDDPLWTAALERARASVADMQALQQSGHEVWIKFPLQPAGGELEHFWGRVESASEDTLVVVVETQPVAGGAVPRHTTVPMHELEDWQVQLPDGSIRGGFTTRAQAAIARREGHDVPRHIAEMLGRMTDT